MGDALMQCPECGAETQDTEWCDECGASLIDARPSHQEEGEFVLSSEDGQSVTIEIAEVLEAFPGRRSLLCEVKTTETDVVDVGEVLIVEEKSTDDGRAFAIPKEVVHLFRRPVLSSQDDEIVIQAFRDIPGMNLADLVSLANGRLSFRQIVDVFLAVSDSIADAHKNGYLILALSPWTVRVEGGDLERRAKRDEETDSGPQPTAPIDLMDVDDVLKEEDFHEDVSEPEFVADETIEDDTLIESSSGDTDEESEGNADSEESEGSDDETEGEVSKTEIEVEIDPNVANSIAESTENVENQTLTGNSVFENVTASFEGIDFIVPLNAEPDEVPVIMGFSAPEFFGPYAREINESCDVFALGMLLYFLACGRIPPSSLYSRHAPAFGFRALRPGFPPGLQPVISKATHPIQSERFASVEAFRNAFLNACEKIDQRVRRVGEPVPRPKLRLAVETHVGITKRLRNPVNQDAVFGRTSDDGAFSLIVVADGVSTAEYGSGDLASHFLIEQAERVWDDILPRYLMDDEIDPITVISDILTTANQQIVDYVNTNFQPFEGDPHEVMGSTALLAVYKDGFMTTASLGDSRVYLFNELGLEQLTVDHNLWTLSIIEGVPPDSAMGMPHGDALARCLGTFRIEDGVLNAIKPEPDFFRFVCLNGDTILMTTDGLVDFGGAHPLESERNIEFTLRAEPLPELVALELILLANRGGGGDNIGVGVLKFGSL